MALYLDLRRMQLKQSAELAHFRQYCREVALGCSRGPILSAVYYVLSAADKYPKAPVRVWCLQDLGITDRDLLLKVARLAQSRLSRHVKLVSLENPQFEREAHLLFELKPDITKHQLAAAAAGQLCGCDPLKRTALHLSYSESLCLDPDLLASASPLPNRIHWTVMVHSAKTLVDLYSTLYTRKFPSPTRALLRWDPESWSVREGTFSPGHTVEKSSGEKVPSDPLGSPDPRPLG